MLLPYVVYRCARVWHVFLLLCVFNVHSVYVYKYLYTHIYIYIIDCIVRSVTDARDNRSLGHRNARRSAKRELFFFPTAFAYGERERARSRVSRIRHSPFVESHTTFLRTTSLYRRHIKISFYSHSNRSQTRQRSTAHVYPRYQFLKIFLTRFRLTFSLRFDICSDDWSRWRILVSRPFPMRVSLEKNSPGGYPKGRRM